MKSHRDRTTAAFRVRHVPAIALWLAAPCLVPDTAFGWGLAAHRIVTEAAVEKVPADAAAYFRKMSARLSDASLEPDTVLRAQDPNTEGRRHYINLDALAAYPFETIPREYEDAQSLYGEHKLKKEGLLPWRIAGVLKDLTAAMRRKDAHSVATQAGYLAHYVADSRQPLHLTMNHDGEATCNQGVHQAFESEMIERSAARYRDAVRRSRATVAAVERPLRALFAQMRDDFPLAERILEADTAAMLALKRDGKDYWEELERRAGPVAERQLAASAASVASFWYTAWLEAGKPVPPSP